MAKRDEVRERIAAANVPASEIHEVPGWGEVEIRGLTARELDEVMARAADAEDQTDRAGQIRLQRGIQRAMVAASALVDGAPVFDGPEDALLLEATSYEAIEFVWSIAARLCGIQDDEEAEKN